MNEKYCMLFTIGYEGLSSEAYFHKLVENNVKLLCDVRKNAISRKKGFSKSSLKEIASNYGIEYVHFRELGIDSEYRKNLKTQMDYDRLLNQYELRILSEQSSEISNVVTLLQQYERIALTCFESQHVQCHRSRVAQVVALNPKLEIKVEHL
ncbi:MAG: hypothetical protein RIS84_1771 [Pseudomonadota bacterium]|jgi:uncharacterized protein (DUF488 family)